MPSGGCHGEDEWVSDAISDRCPVMFMGDYVLAFDAYRYIEQSLPYSGGSMEQPIAMMQAIDIVRNVSDTHNAKIGRKR